MPICKRKLKNKSKAILEALDSKIRSKPWYMEEKQKDYFSIKINPWENETK